MKSNLLILITFFFIMNLQCDPPDWEVIGGTQYSMIVMAEINHNDQIFTNAYGNIVAAFGPGGEDDCRSLGYWQPANPPYHDGFWYFTIVGNEPDYTYTPIHFKVYDGMAEEIYPCYEQVTFQNNQSIGEPLDLFKIYTEVIELGIIEGTVHLYSGSGSIEETIIQVGNNSINPGLDGTFFSTLPGGIYSAIATLDGYFSHVVEPVIVAPGQTTSGVDFYLYSSQNISFLLPETAVSSSGQNVQLKVYMNNPDVLEIDNVMIDIEYDQEVLSFVNPNFIDTELDGLGYEYLLDLEDGKVLLWINSNGASYAGSGAIVNLEFQISSNATVQTQTIISIEQAIANEIESLTNSCVLTIVEFYDILGSVYYYSNHLPVHNTQILLVGSQVNSASTNTSGTYQLISNPYDTYFSNVDKSDDLKGLSSLDVSRVARFASALYDFDCYQKIAADVTLSGNITSNDAYRLARYGVGLIQNLNTISKHWVFTAGEVENCSEWPPIQYDANYQYNPLDSDEVNQDYVGIRLGDVTGNWQQDRRTGDRNFHASLPNLEAEENTTVSVPMYVENLEELEGMDIKIEYDSSILQAISANLDNTILEDNNFAYQVNVNEPGVIILWLYSLAHPYSGSGEIVNLIFEVTGPVGETSELSFTQLNVNDIDYLANTTAGSITVLASDSDENVIEVKSTKIIGNYPNPFNPETTIRFYLEESSWALLSIYNVKGQLVRNMAYDELGTGNHDIVWDGKDSQQQELSSGIYFYRLETEHFSDTKKCILIK